jgi:death-on-curing protein
MIHYLTEEEIVAINMIIIQNFSPKEQIGIKSPELLNSSVNRPKQSAFGEEAYLTIFDKAIALFESIAKNHVFQNANKRTAFASLIQFLEYNGYDFVMPEKNAEDFTVDVVNHKFEFFEMVEIIKSNTKQKI